METLLSVGASNAVMATILALVAALVGCCCRRPAFMHALWLLVLLKLLTPPMQPVAVHWFQGAERAPAEISPIPPLQLGSLSNQAGLPEETSDLPLSLTSSTEENLSNDLSLADGRAAETVAPPPQPWPWANALAALWLAGSACWFTLACWRICRFQRLLRGARPAPASLEEQARHLTGRLGLARCPTILILPGTICPMIWTLGGRARLLLPSDLLERLSQEQRATLLVHELAHLRRRDHWVRILELLTTGLYWWLPILWWARREIQEAEEQCCDAWVLWALPGSGRTYALGLVETVDFLSEARPARPVLASGFGHVQSLKRRITMIMRGTTSRSLTWTGLLAVLGLGVALLPLVPTWAQTPPGGDIPEQGIVQRTEAERAEAEKALKQAADDQRRRALEQRDRAASAMMEAAMAQEREARRAQERELLQRQVEEAARLHDETELLQLQVAGKEAEVQEAEARVKQAQRHLAQMKKLAEKGTLGSEELDRATTETEVLQAQSHAKKAQLQEAQLRFVQAKRRLAQLGDSRRGRAEGGEGPARRGEGPVGGGRGEADPGAPTSRRVAPPRSAATTSGSTASGAGTEVERRLIDAEKRIDALVSELERLRKEVQQMRRRSDSPAGGTGSGTRRTPPVPGGPGAPAGPAGRPTAPGVPGAPSAPEDAPAPPRRPPGVPGISGAGSSVEDPATTDRRQ